jgi:hypothetical protein
MVQGLAKYGGVYRGMVVNSVDPAGQGRVQVRLVSLMITTGWAPVCTAPGAPPNALPPLGGTVIVAFEGGDLDSPIVLGSI